MTRLLTVRLVLADENNEIERDLSCDGCKYWKSFDHDPSYGNCDCRGDKIDSALLNTKSDFGCVEWEAK